ncbi:uncharacterized protein LOC121422993 isoform X1 [Lytechinus variegatus]|uniref:uncharacterized protein LOC121422993 isoform X1 n=1 Tax=Lytechinus variegatus TaxID=7654 RepID=UPI001BB24876|nr:uncharacterized protein LOC121422993 isoform X1 [Lytechinus variegatus]
MIPPTFTGCPGSAIGVVPQGSTNVSVYWIPPMTEDNSGLVTLSSDRDPGDIFPVGSFPVVYTSRDMAGNSVSSCRFLVNVTMSTGEINAGPVLMNCPSDMTINLPVTSSEVAVSWTPPTADDDASTPIVTSDIQPGSMFGYGSTLVTYTAIDSQGVEDTCSFTVQVRDQTTPFIMDCPSSANGVLPQASSSDVPVFWTPPTHTDNSGMSTLRSTHIPGSSFREGTTEVLYTAVDVAGNLDECRFTVTVTSPEVVNPPPVILNCPSRRLGVLSDSSSVAVSWTEPTATDDTGTPTLTSNVRPGSDFRFGIATVTYTAEDDGGAIATCSFNVQVKDVTAPAITGCPASASATLLPGSTSVSVTWTPPTQTDNSGVSSLTSTHEPGSMFSAGDTEVTYTAIDTAGNTNQCSLVVTVILLSDVRCVTPAISTNLNSVGDQCSQPVEITFNAQCNYQCNSGYSIVGDTTLSCGMDGRLVGTFPTCQDTNECSASSPPCVDPNSFCLNTIGSFTCQCSDGYQSSMDGSCQRIQDESCSTVSCQNSGTCMEGTNGPVCQCGDTSTGPLCQIDLTCGATTCHSSQVCLNGQCVCPEGTRLVQGRCQDECAVSCDQFTERCVQTLSGLTCLCRPNRDRSYWTNACIERLQMFIISFAINRIGLQLVDFNDNYRNPQSPEYMIAASAVQNLLPRILVSQGVRGIINVGVVRFFQGSLMTEVSIPVGADFVGDASTISDAITAYLNSNDNTVSDGTHQLEIQPQVQAEETTVINECADVATNDCSSNSTCINDVSGVGYTCQCLQGLVDLYPTLLPGRHCVPVATDINECQTSTTCSDENSFCLNTVGSFVCVCDDGYEMTANGVCQVQVAQCSSTSCQNSGTCSVGTPEPVCTCSSSFAGAACEIDLRCGNGNCHLSQVCSNGLCTCPEGTELSLGICINQCSSSCDLQREICMQTSSGSYTCECRQDRDRSFWTRQCVTRVREFFIRFIVAEIGVLAVDYSDQYANEQSQEYQDAAEAIQNLLPRILLAQGVQGIINVGVQGFFPGSLGVDCRIPVSADFTGDENTILDAILSHLRNNGNTLSDGTFRLEIPGDLVTTRDAVTTTVLPVQTGGVVSDGEVNIGLIVGVIGGVLLLICILSIGACLMFARTRQLNQLRRKGAVQSEEYGTDDLIYRLAASIPNVYFQSPGPIEEAPSPPSPQENTPPAPQKEKRKHRRRKGPFFYHPA